MGCREAPHQPGLHGRRGRTRSCRSVCSTQPGPGRTQSPQSPLYLCNPSPGTQCHPATTTSAFAQSEPCCVHTELHCLQLHQSFTAQGGSSCPLSPWQCWHFCSCQKAPQHCRLPALAITPTGEHSSAIPPPCHAAELLKLTLLLHIATTVILFPPTCESLHCSSPLRFVSATPAFGWVQNPVQKEWPDRN